MPHHIAVEINKNVFETLCTLNLSVQNTKTLRNGFTEMRCFHALVNVRLKMSNNYFDNKYSQKFEI